MHQPDILILLYVPKRFFTQIVGLGVSPLVHSPKNACKGGAYVRKALGPEPPE